MDLELHSLLKNCLIYNNSAHDIHMQSLLKYSDRYLQINEKISDSDVLISRLLWLISHYISAVSSSHGSEIGYIHNQESNFFILSKLDALADVLPPTVSLKLFRKGEISAQTLACGRWTSDFEKNDLKIFRHDEDTSSRRLGIVLIQHDGMSESYLKWVEEILKFQPLLSHVLILSDDKAKAPIPTSISTWNVTEVPGLVVGLDLTVLANPQWETDLAAAPRLITSPPPAETGETVRQPELILPIVSESEFPDLTWVTITPEETLAGPEITIYDLNSDGGLSLQYGRLSPITVFERKHCVCQDVCVSHVGVVWRNDRVLRESFAASPHDAHLYHSPVAVSEPSLHLEGTYFLVPTANTHHSHMMLETLTQLDTIAQYRPKIKLLLSNILTNSQREYLSIFGFSDEDLVFKNPDETFRVEKLIISVTSFYPNRHSTKYLQNIAARYCDSNATQSELIYLSRRDARVYRNLVNEDEIEKIFISFGFKSVLASELSPKQKIALFSSARCVAGPLGAAFLYMPFVSTLEQIILTSDLYFPAEFIYNASIQMSKVHYIKGTGLKYHSLWKYQHSSFYIPPDLIRLSLQNILPRISVI